MKRLLHIPTATYWAVDIARYDNSIEYVLNSYSDQNGNIYIRIDYYKNNLFWFVNENFNTTIKIKANEHEFELVDV